ncbi:MAG: tetraspanin family protein [archaeon]|nr:tetraspanin family protein [archaeon]
MDGLPSANRERLAKFRRKRGPLRVTPKSVGACGRCVKCMIGCMSTLVYAFNLFFFVLGVLLLGAGIYAQVQLGHLAVLLDVPFSVAMIVLASVVICLTFFGCAGAYCKKRGLLKVYWVLLLVIILLQVALGMVIYFERSSLVTVMGTSWHDPQNDATKVYLQDKFSCCGWANVTDSPSVSVTCPASSSPDARDDPSPPPPDNAAPVGCQAAIVDFFNSQVLVLEIVAIAVSSAELVALFFSFCLIFLIRPDSVDDDLSDPDSIALLEDI